MRNVEYFITLFFVDYVILSYPNGRLSFYHQQQIINNIVIILY